jgi:hypothetical protein
MKDSIKLRPYIFARCEEFAFQLCKEQGWFGEKKFDQLTAADKQEVYWENNWQIAVRSYIFWEEDYG